MSHVHAHFSLIYRTMEKLLGLYVYSGLFLQQIKSYEKQSDPQMQFLKASLTCSLLDLF